MAIFSINFDDANDSDKQVYDIFNNFGFIPSFALPLNGVSGDNISFYIKAFEMGCSILSHSLDAKPMGKDTQLSGVEIEDRMKVSKERLSLFGFDIYGWVTPSSTLSTQYGDYVKKYYNYAFTNISDASGHLSFNRSVDLHSLRRVGIEGLIKTRGIDGVKQRIDQAIEMDELCVFYAHRIPSSYHHEDGSSVFRESDLLMILSYLKEKISQGDSFLLPTDTAVRVYYGIPLS